jgi:hypothetical protein
MLDDSIDTRAAKLRKTIELLSSASETLITEWKKTGTTDTQSTPRAVGFQLPSHAEYEAEQIVKAALGTIEALACSAEIRALEVNIRYVESRALHIALNHHVPEILAEQGQDGVHVDELGMATGLEKNKLGKPHCNLFAPRKNTGNQLTGYQLAFCVFWLRTTSFKRSSRTISRTTEFLKHTSKMKACKL